MTVPIRPTEPAHPDALGRVGRGSAINLLGGAVSVLGSLGLTVLLTRGLDARDAGGFFTATSLFLLLATLSQLGTTTGLVYFLGRLDPDGRRARAREYLRIAARGVAPVSTLAGIGLVVLAGPIADLVTRGPSGGVADALRWLGVALPFAAVLTLFGTGTRGLGAMWPTVVLDQVLRPLLQVVLVATALVADRPALVVPAWALPYVLAALAAARAWATRTTPTGRTTRISPDSRIWQISPISPGRGAADPATRRAFWRFTAPRALAGAVQVALQRLDIVLVAGIAGLRDAAVYTAATRFLVIGQVVGQSIGRSVQPRLARALGRGDLSTAAAIYRTGTGWQVLLCWPVYLVLAVAATPALRVFGTTYTAGAAVVVILALAMLVATACGTVDVVLTMAGRTSWSLANTALAFVVNVVLDVLLIPPYGVTGAAVGWAVAIVLTNLVPLAQVRATTRLHPFGRSTVTAMTLGAVCFGVVPAAVRLLDGSTPALAVAVAVGGALWTVAAWRSRERLELAALGPRSPIS